MLIKINFFLIVAVFAFTSAMAQDKKGDDKKDNVEVTLTQEAYYPKGDKILYKYIYRNLNLDSTQVPSGLETDVTLIFTVNLDSSIRDFKVLQDPSGIFEAPMTRLFTDTRFVPSEENGQPVVTKVLLKVPFTYESIFLEQEGIQPIK